MVKNLPASSGDARNLGLIPGSGRSPGGGNGYPLHILGWEIPWTEEPGRLQALCDHGVTRLRDQTALECWSPTRVNM